MAVFADWYDQLVAELAPQQVVFVHNSATLTPIGFAGHVDPAGYQAHVLLNSAAPQVLGDTAIRIACSHRTPTVVAQLSSGAADSPYPGWSGYCASKAAVEMWVKAVGTELAAGTDPVRVMAIRPGIVATEMQAEIRSSDPSAFPNVERFREFHAGGALADPAEVGAKIWSAAVSTDWANGAVLDVRQMKPR